MGQYVMQQNCNLLCRAESKWEDILQEQATSLYRNMLRHGKTTSIEELSTQLHGATRLLCISSKDVLDFAVRKMPNLFDISLLRGQLAVKALVTIQFCKEFESKNGCQKERCPSLHVCRHFVKDKCTFGVRCKKPHHFKGEHTGRLLEENLLDQIDESEVKNILCRFVQFSLDEFNQPPPKHLQVCQYYNVKIGCIRGYACPYLHVCKFYATSGGFCKFGCECIRNHCFSTRHSKALLDHYGMSEASALSYLTTTTPGGSRSRSSSSTTDSLLEQGDTTTPLDSDDAVTPTSRVNADFENHLPNKICSYHLKGKCYAGNECLFIHKKQPYSWQLKRRSGDHHPGSTWLSVTDDMNTNIEAQFCRVEIDACMVTPSESFEMVIIDFVEMKATEVKYNDEDSSLSMLGGGRQWGGTVLPFTKDDAVCWSAEGESMDVRRLSTISAEDASSGEAFATTWRSYTKDGQQWKTADANNPCSLDSTINDSPSHRLRPEFTTLTLAKQKYEWFCNKRIQRLLAGRGFPKHWHLEKDPALEFVQVPLETNDKMHLLLSRWIHSTMPRLSVIKITMIQNVDLWDDYQTSKSSIVEMNAIKEELMFIGTTSRKIRATYQQGFFSDKRAAVANNAAYCNELSRYPEVADLQAMEDSRGYRHIFAARTLIKTDAIASHCEGDPQTKISLPDPVIIPITNRQHIYPEFLITYIIE